MATSDAVTLECLECAKTWRASLKTLTSANVRCPKCRGYDVDVRAPYVTNRISRFVK